MIEAFCLLIFMTLTGIMLLSMAIGMSPVDNWHTGLIVAGSGLSIGAIISLWLKSEGIVKD